MEKLLPPTKTGAFPIYLDFPDSPSGYDAFASFLVWFVSVVASSNFMWLLEKEKTTNGKSKVLN